MNSDKIQKYKKKHHLQSTAKMAPKNTSSKRYGENYKTLMNEIKKYLNKPKYATFVISRLNTIKVLILLNSMQFQ